MKRRLQITEDGSHTLYVPELDEPYHSIHGALQESMHVFINQGFNKVSASPLRILELGFGTGLNALLTFIAGWKDKKRIFYQAVEKYPLRPEEYKELNYHMYTGEEFRAPFMNMHEAPWEVDAPVGEGFVIRKEKADFSSMNPEPPFDLVYFDAFDPNKQPELWTEEIFEKISHLVIPGAVLVTYSAKGSVRRALNACGFAVEKVPGPPGKREMVRAIRI